MWLVSQYALFLSENLLQLAERLCKHLVHKLQITGRQTVLLTQQPLEEHSAEWDVQLGTWQHTHEMFNWEHDNIHMRCSTGNMTTYTWDVQLGKWQHTHEMFNWEHDKTYTWDVQLGTWQHTHETITSIFSEKISPANDGLFVVDGLFVHEGLYVYVQLT